MSDFGNDFYSEEYEKKQAAAQKNAGGSGNGGNGGGYNDRGTVTTGGRVTIIILSVAVVLAFLFGWLLSTLIYRVRGGSVHSDSLLSVVSDTLENRLYNYLNGGRELTEEEWNDVIANGGTAMLQTVDQYGQLLSPQQAYDLLFPTTTDTNAEYFGFTFANSLAGLYVYDVTADSAAFGRLQSGDMIRSLSDVTYYDNAPYSDATVNLADAETYQNNRTVLAYVKSATFHVLRGDAVLILPLARNKIGSSNNTENFAYVEYYFGADNTNVSLTPEHGAAVSTYEYRHLDELPADVGYIRLSGFGSYDNDGDGVYEISSDREMKAALTKFVAAGCSKLILDLKGNPGGDVDIAANIISMLADTESAAYKKDGKLLGSYVKDKNGNTIEYYSAAASTYSDSFGALPAAGEKKSIVVWLDGNSASASEMLLGALLDYGTAVQMGTTSYGKGIVQYVAPLNYYGDVVTSAGKTERRCWYIYYTAGLSYSPKGNNVQGKGYTPEAEYAGLSQYADLIAAAKAYWNV